MLRVHERKMRLILIFLFVSTISACSSLKQSDYLAPFIKEKPLTVLPEKKAIELSGDKNTIKSENRAVVPYFEIIFYDEDSPVLTKVGEEKEIISSKLVGSSNKLKRRIVDKAYNNFISQMKNKGLEILPISSLSSSPTYTSFSKDGLKKIKKTIFGPGGTSVSPSGMNTSNSEESRGKQISKIMDEMNASVMNITLYITYMNRKVDPRSNSPYSIDVEQKISVIRGSRMQFFGLKASQCEGYCSSPVVNAKLGKSISSLAKVGDLSVKNKKSNKKEVKKQITTSDSDLKSQAADLSEKAIKWISALSEKKDDLRYYELRIDPVKYEKIIGDLLEKSTKKLVEEITFYGSSPSEKDDS